MSSLLLASTHPFLLFMYSFFLRSGRWQRDAASCDALTQPLSFSREAQEVFGFHQELFILEYPAACSFLENKQVSQPDGKHVCRQTVGTVGSGGEEGNLPLLIVVQFVFGAETQNYRLCAHTHTHTQTTQGTTTHNISKHFKHKS